MAGTAGIGAWLRLAFVADVVPPGLGGRMKVDGRRWSLAVGATVTALIGSLLVSGTAHAVVSSPYAVITSPTDGSAVTGVVYATAYAGVLPGAGDAVRSIRWYVNGALRAEHLCGPGPSDVTCTDVLTVDTTQLPSGCGCWLQAELVTANGVTFTSFVSNFNVPVDPLRVSILSPAPEDSVSGTVSVSAEGAIGASVADTAGSLTLLVDDVATDTAACPTLPDPKQCTLSLSWNAVGATGAHTLRVRMRTGIGKYATSPAVPVLLPSPTRSARISSPAPGAVVTGVVPVTVVAVDPTAGDAPESMALYVDGHEVDSAYCTAGTNVSLCATTLSWDSRHVTGFHVLSTSLTTRNKIVVTSAPVRVGVLSRTVTVLTRPRAVVSGALVTVRGKVTRANDGGPAAGVRVVVRRTSAVGRDTSVTTTTSATGTFAAVFRVMTNSTFRSQTVATAMLGSSVRSMSLPVMAASRCRAISARVRRGQLARGYCIVPYLPAHTLADLLVRYQGRWVTLAQGFTGSGRVFFGVRFRPRGVFYVRLRFYGSRVFVPSSSQMVKFTVT